MAAEGSDEMPLIFATEIATMIVIGGIFPPMIDGYTLLEATSCRLL